MSSFYCPKCGVMLVDTPIGYVTGCEHYPADVTEEEYQKWLKEEGDE